MSTDRFRKIERLFEQALELPQGERTAFLTRACGDDVELRGEVESLLGAHDRAGSFLEQPAIPTSPGATPHTPTPHTPTPRTPTPRTPTSPVSRSSGMQDRVGPYQLLRRIGEGGMSEVYLAVRDDDEYKKSVALKVIRHDLDREDVIRRFRTERQILAGLDHPNIAKLLDGGTTDEGLPYFVMDYIEGVPFDRYCDGNRLTVRERLELFRTVCSAVQYAHQSLVVHRDIKSSNILVSADGVPRLLDFGIAKLLKPDQFAQPVERTATWLRPMTPHYASPEQVQGKMVTTSSDVYSLGVLLYKLLTGRLPHDPEGKPPTEFARMVVEDEADAPSAVVTRPVPVPVDDGTGHTPATAVTAQSIAAARRSQPPQLRRALEGDLDNIVLMALRKEPQRRYASVEQLAEDIRRYLVGLPVIARKDTFGYRSAKFLRRNWLAVAASVGFVALLAGFGVTMAVQASRIAHERDQARRERDRAERVVAFMKEIFEVSDPLEGAGRDVPASEILDSGARRVTEEMADEPDVQATLLASIGNVYRNLGLFERARPLLEQAVEIRQRLYGERHVAVAESLHDLGVVNRDLGNFQEAELLLKQALEQRRELIGTDSDEVVATLNYLGIVKRQLGEYDESEAYYRESIAIHERALGETEELATAKNNLATLSVVQGRLEDGERLFREALELRRKLLGAKHPIYAQNLTNLGASLGMQGKYAEAEPFLREAVELMRELLDPEHPALMEALNNLAKLNVRMGNLDAAEPLYREALALERKRAGERHPHVASVGCNLAELLAQKGDLDGAEELYRLALDIRREALGDEHPETGSSLVLLGGLLVGRDRAAAAEPLLKEGIAIYERTLPAGHWKLAEASSALGECYAAQRRYTDAEPLLIQGYEGLKEKRGPEHPLTRTALDRVVELYRSWGRPDEAKRFSSS